MNVSNEISVDSIDENDNNTHCFKKAQRSKSIGKSEVGTWVNDQRYLSNSKIWHEEQTDDLEIPSLFKDALKDKPSEEKEEDVSSLQEKEKEKKGRKIRISFNLGNEEEEEEEEEELNKI
eukprot:4277169-Ditylum_brightwellii.AAC.1